MHVCPLFLGLPLLLCVLLDSVQELFSGSRQCDVFHADIDTLLDVPVADFLVDNDADGRFGNVVDHTGLAMVDFEGHALLYSAVGFDVDYVSNSGIEISIGEVTGP